MKYAGAKGMMAERWLDRDEATEDGLYFGGDKEVYRIVGGSLEWWDGECSTWGRIYRDELPARMYPIPEDEGGGP